MPPATTALRQSLAPGTDTLENSLRFLVARYARSPDTEVARAVINQLTLLLRQPRVLEQPDYRTYLRRQLAHWTGLIGTELTTVPGTAHWTLRNPQ
ncbi:hypothetical protein [Thiohalorhabdus methylotrophus]|uniref:Uncharacterized protein n=1 Tax=Thiohalorhabdus methylotrophus TaxID=3242694 RepID=A0ABV4TYI2_9GAMM